MKFNALTVSKFFGGIFLFVESSFNNSIA